MNLIVNNIWACHIGFLTYLLKLNCNIISSIGKNFNFTNSDLLNYYIRICDILYTETNTYYEPNYFCYYLQNCINIYTSPHDNQNTIILPQCTSVYDAEYNFFKLLHDNNIISNLQLYGINKNETLNVIRWVISQIYERNVSHNEVLYFYNKNIVYRIYSDKNIKYNNISLTSFLLNLRFYPEGKLLKYQWDFINEFKLLKLSTQTSYIPKCAVILSGHTRNYLNTFSNLYPIIENPYMDIHIHTWNNRGIRMEYNFEKNDPTVLSNIYRPSTFQIDNVNQLDFSNFAVTNLTPIFLYNGQKPSDDPPKYVNQQLYSTYQAYNNIIQYESNNNFNYDCILRLKFDFNLLKFDYKEFSLDILGWSNGYKCPEISLTGYSSYKNTLWFSKNNVDGHYWHGGGCRMCDYDKSLINHSENGHLNDVNDTLFYGRRDIVSPLCSFYLHASNIYKIFVDSNVNMMNILLSNQKFTHCSFSNKNFRISQNHFIYTYTLDDTTPFDSIIPYHANRLMRIMLKSNIIRSTNSIDGEIDDVLYKPYSIYSL